MTGMVIEAAARGLLLAIVVGAGLAVLRVTNVPMRKAAWSLVLVASLAMPFLMRWPAMTGLGRGLGWVVPIHRLVPSRAAAVRTPFAAKRAAAMPAAIPFAPEAAIGPRRRSADTALTLTVPTVLQAAKRVEAGTPAPAMSNATSAATAFRPRHRWQWPPPGRVIPTIYLTVSGLLLLRLLWGVFAAAWLWMRAEEISPLDVPEENVRVSRRIPSPVTIGSGIVLPGSYREWDRNKLRVVLAHERSHVRQMDFYLQLLAGLYAAAFWFSPLGWWLKRELSHLGEAISDRAGLEAARSRSDYAGVLLEFAATTQGAVPGVAMARRGNLARRVDRLLNDKLFQKAFSEGRRRAAVSLLLVPAALFAVTAMVRVPGAAAQTQAISQIPPVPLVTPVVQDAIPAQPTEPSNPVESPVTITSVEGAEAPAAPALPPAPPATGGIAISEDAAPPQAAPAPSAGPRAAPKVAPAPPVPPSDEDMPMVLDMAPMPEVRMLQPNMKMVLPKASVMLDDEMPQLRAQGGWGSGFALAGPGENFSFGPDGGAHGFAYFFSSNGDSWAIVDGAGKNFSMGSGSDRQSLDLAQRMAKGPFLWFSHDGKSYIVDDASIVARIQALYAPMRDLAHQRDALAVQERVMARMEAERARQDRTEASVRVPDLSKEMADVQATLDSLKSQQGQMLSEEKLAEMQARLAEMEARLGSLQARSATQNNFAEKMRVLFEQQRQMAEQQRQFSEKEKSLATQAQQQVQSIIHDCLHDGKATPVR